jgi:hypothetical protein
MVITLILLAVSGLAILFGTHGQPMPGVKSDNPPILSEGGSFRHIAKELHELVGLMFLIVGSIHIKYNWNALIMNFKRKQ